MKMLEQAAEAAQELGISERDALTLTFLAYRAWALVKGDNKSAAIMQIGAAHAAGSMNGDIMHQCLAIVKPRKGRREP